ncbi:MAG: hypothetical protein DMF85_04030, partial [Acidobacteria bacterium]
MSAAASRPFVSVKFTPAGRTYSFLLPDLALDDEQPAPPLKPGETVVVDTPDGRALATVARVPSALAERRTPAADSSNRVVRRATHEDVVHRLKQQQREQEAHRVALLKIRERGLGMKLTRVEHLFDGSRLIFYYTAEGRVDFRELVRDLAAHFRTRIEHDVAQVVRARVDQDGEAAAAQPEPVEAVGAMRAAEVLPSLRAAERERREAWRLRRSRRVLQPDRPGPLRIVRDRRRRLRLVPQITRPGHRYPQTRICH